MQLIKETIVPEKTPAQKIAELVLGSINAEFARRLEFRRSLWAMVWGSPVASTAEIMSELGTNAHKVFDTSAEDARSIRTLASIWGLDPEEALADGEIEPVLSVLPQEDGSIIIDEPAPALPEEEE